MPWASIMKKLTGLIFTLDVPCTVTGTLSLVTTTLTSNWRDLFYIKLLKSNRFISRKCSKHKHSPVCDDLAFSQLYMYSVLTLGEKSIGSIPRQSNITTVENFPTSFSEYGFRESRMISVQGNRKTIPYTLPYCSVCV